MPTRHVESALLSPSLTANGFELLHVKLIKPDHSRQICAKFCSVLLRLTEQCITLALHLIGTVRVF